MEFLERAKEILLKENEKKLTIIDEKIKKWTKVNLKEKEEVESLKRKVDEHSFLDKNQLNDLRKIYEFIANYPRIEKIVEKIKELSVIYEEELYSSEGTEIQFWEEYNRRNKLYEKLKELNEQIVKINDANIEDIENQDGVIKTESEKQKKKSFFSKIYKKTKKNEISKKTNIENNSEKAEKIFNKYRQTINWYNKYHNRFSFLDKEANLDLLEPLELWKEILKYYSNTQLISTIIQNFASKIDKYEEIYEEIPELYDLQKLEKIFKENNQIVIDLRSNKKEEKVQLRTLVSRRKELIEKSKKVQQAKNLKQLGYKNKAEAEKKLSIETKDYIVIPIPNEVKNIFDLFKEENQVKVEYDDKKFLAVYSNDIASGKINTAEHIEKNVNSVLLVPIKNLEKSDIDNIRKGKISINQSVLKMKNLLAIIPQGKKINFKDSNVETKEYSHGDIYNQVKQFIGEDYVINSRVIENYDIFKDIPYVSNKEKKLKREAIKKCLFENVNKDISHGDIILVDGETFFLNQNDEKDLRFMPKSEALDEKKLEQISDKIESYLIEDGKNGNKINEFYTRLLLEYMRINKKAKANYQDESDTIINFKGKKINIKPPLPPKNETITKRYTRPGEDVAYRTMKLASLVNRFAHLTENEKLKNKLFQNKLDLVENVIDLSENNPKINMKRHFDEKKKVMSVILEIPGYNMIALHLMNKGRTLTRKSNQLDKSDNDVVQTSTILYPGVNRELLLEMKKMEPKERIQMLLDLDSNTFYKLVLRMGYNSENISSKKDKKSFIEEMVSDEKIFELLKDDEELEK